MACLALLEHHLAAYAMQLAGPDTAACQRSKKLGLWLTREGSEALV